MNNFDRMKQKYFQFSLALCMLCISTLAFADDALPWEGPMQKILDSLTGPVARILGVIAIVIAGFGIAFGEAGSGVRRLFQVILGLSIVYSAAALIMNLFGVSN